ncbi:MutS-related protein [Paraburkholderia sp. J12]|uniref:MutS-related protein n=1 Tax=Paraburkholderia sp. J12 TaxID=2805432 RepID=UPI002ABDC257|nr:DNA mismatch repair protein MutS [Paraburkholderia sp. J12]
MRVLLLHPHRDFDPGSAQSETLESFSTDLGLDILMDAACGRDRFLYDTLSAALSVAWDNDRLTIAHRQDVLRDCVKNGAFIRALYRLACEPFDRNRSWEFGLYGRETSSMVSSSVRTLRSSLALLKRIRNDCRLHAEHFSSVGFTNLFDVIERNLDDDYLRTATHDLDRLRFGAGVLLSAGLGNAGKAQDIRLRIPTSRDLNVLLRLVTPGSRTFTFRLDPRDLSGARAFGELQDRGLGLISRALWNSAHHVLGFLKALRTELAFCVAGLNLDERLAAIGESVSWPVVRTGEPGFQCKGLKDVCLSLTTAGETTGNEASAVGKPLVIVTGVNRGGKSTFLRSVGLAELMLHAGLFVTAEHFSSSLHTGLFTHFKREEDRSMESGKFDEELRRLGAMADHIRRGALVLFNESFAATNEQEGAEIARQVTRALLDEGVTVIFVSHMYDFARGFIGRDDVLFLRADRKEEGHDAFRLVEGLPQSTSFGLDIYEQVFGLADDQCNP